MKSSRLSVLFAQERGIARFQGQERVNPQDFTKDEMQDFLAFKKEKDKLRYQNYYKADKESGKLMPHKLVADLTEEELTKKRESGRRAAIKLRMRERHPDYTEDQLNSAVEEAMVPREGNEVMKRGPPKGCKMSARPKRCKQDPEETSEIGEGFVSEPRIKGKHSAIDYLKLFLEKNQDAPKVSKPSELPQEWVRPYQRFRTNYNQRCRYAEDPNKFCQKRKEQRSENPEHFRAIEAKYRSTKKGKETKAAYEKRDYVKERRKVWKKANPERQRIYHKTYRERYYEKERERVKQFLRFYRTTDKYAEYKENFLKSPEYRWYCVQSSAKARNLIVELNKQDVIEMCSQPCYYCGDDPENLNILFGIDRVDNSQGYTKANCVTCCTFCNYAKCDYHVEDFVRGMSNIAASFNDQVSWSYNYTFTDPSKVKLGMDYNKYCHSAKQRKIDFLLSENEFQSIVGDCCFYCQCPTVCGVDRVDNNIGYTIDNCVPCCSFCNRLKKNWDVGLFLSKALSVYLNCNNLKSGTA